MGTARVDSAEPVRVLICEDNPAIALMLESVLRNDGHDVARARSKDEALQRLADWSPHLLLLDLVLLDSESEGWELLTEARNRTPAPIIVISGLGRASGRVRALKAGADDYITKPFDLDEVRARVHAVLRRGKPHGRRGGFVVDDGRKMVVVDGRSVALSPKEYQLLRLLSSSAGAVISTAAILRELWPPSERTSATRQDVQKYVYLLRRKLEEDPSNPRRVLTVRGVGYRLAA